MLYLQIMFAIEEARQGDSVTRKLRECFDDNVKISKKDMTFAMTLVKDYIEDEVISYFDKSVRLPRLRLEYTRSMYNRLKSEATDEVDLLIILETTSLEVQVENSGISGYATLKDLTAGVNSPLRKFADRQGYLNPERLKGVWLNNLDRKFANGFKVKSTWFPVSLKVSSHNGSFQLQVFKNDTDEVLLTADLVPCLQIPTIGDFVAKPCCDAELLWRKSFSLKEKEMLKKMDEDGGCRHELLRIVKSIIKNRQTYFGKLKSYHVKTAFMHYMTKVGQNWCSDYALGEHFLGFLEQLQRYLENKTLPHYWLDGRVNLLDDIDSEIAIDNMARDLENIKVY